MEEPEQKQNRNRDAKQPQKRITHGVWSFRDDCFARPTRGYERRFRGKLVGPADAAPL